MTKSIQSVCVYCGAASAVGDVYKNAALSIGRVLAEAGLTLVYGGGRTGLMGLAADAALAAGGNVVGIIPHFIKAREVMHENLTELHVVDSMHERKMMMADRVDAFVVLPGGFGTLDEFFEILTWRQLSLHDKPIILVNVEGYWTKLIALMHGIVEKGFAQPAHLDFVTIADRVEDVPAILASRSGGIQPLSAEKI